jgi:hypothetical protein
MNDNPAAPRALGATWVERLAPWRPAAALLYFSGAALAAKLAQDHHLPWPPCWIRELTGVPCPTCGATRSLLAFTKLDFPSAFHFNPLFSLGLVALTMWVAGVALDRVFGWRMMDRVREAGKRWPLGRIGIGLVALNWVYLCFNLPR